MSKVKMACMAILSLILVGGGINHFVSSDFYARMMPDYLPLHLELVWLSGVIEILLGIGLWVESQRKMVAWGIVALMIAVFPANVHVYLNPELFPEFSPTALMWRLPFQAVFVVWAWWFTRD